MHAQQDDEYLSPKLCGAFLNAEAVSKSGKSGSRSPVFKKLAFASERHHTRVSPLHSPRRLRDGTRNDPSRNPRIRRVIALAFPANQHARAGDALARSNPTSSSSSSPRSLLLPNEAPTLKNAFSSVHPAERQLEPSVREPRDGRAGGRAGARAAHRERRARARSGPLVQQNRRRRRRRARGDRRGERARRVAESARERRRTGGVREDRGRARAGHPTYLRDGSR